MEEPLPARCCARPTQGSADRAPAGVFLRTPPAGPSAPDMTARIAGGFPEHGPFGWPCLAAMLKRRGRSPGPASWPGLSPAGKIHGDFAVKP